MYWFRSTEDNLVKWLPPNTKATAEARLATAVAKVGDQDRFKQRYTLAVLAWLSDRVQRNDATDTLKQQARAHCEAAISVVSSGHREPSPFDPLPSEYLEFFGCRAGNLAALEASRAAYVATAQSAEEDNLTLKALLFVQSSIADWRWQSIGVAKAAGELLDLFCVAANDPA